jgi:predicted O-methyltransferase YrrM
VAEILAPPTVAEVPGWFHHGEQILRLLEQYRPKVVVELGTWMGASAIAMARSVRRWGGTVTCVDTWAGHSAYGDEVGAPLMILPCARYMVQAGVGASLRLIPSTTVAAAAQWHGPIDFLYVDADHSYRGVLADLRAWIPHVRTGGLIVGDDYQHPLFPGVRLAWDDIERDTGGWQFERFQSDPPDPEGIELIYGVRP